MKMLSATPSSTPSAAPSSMPSTTPSTAPSDMTGLVHEAVTARVIAYYHVRSEANVSDMLSKHLGYNETWPLLRSLMFWKGDTIDMVHADKGTSSSKRGVTKFYSVATQRPPSWNPESNTGLGLAVGFPIPDSQQVRTLHGMTKPLSPMTISMKDRKRLK